MASLDGNAARRASGSGVRPRRASRAWRIAAALAALLLAWPGVICARAIRTALRDLYPVRAPVDREAAARSGLRDVTFQAADGVTLRGWFRPPVNGATVVLAHGWGGSRQQMLSHAAVLVRNGFGVLLFDFRAHGESGGRMTTSGDREQLDVSAAVSFASRQPGVRPERLGAVGYSMGGTALVEVAARDHSFAALMLEAVPPTLEEDMRADYQRGRPLAPLVGFLVYRLAGVDVHGPRPIDRLCGLGPRPVLLVYGTEDPAFPAAVGRRMLAAACAPKELWVVPGGGHGGFLELAPDEFERRMVGFFSASLVAAPARAPPAGK